MLDCSDAIDRNAATPLNRNVAPPTVNPSNARPSLDGMGFSLAPCPQEICLSNA